jgi:polyisoprenoid-binding protein YceI
MKKFRYILLFAIALLGNLQVNAQESFELAQNGSSLVIEGTSSMHDWEMKAEKFSGTITVLREGSKIKNFEDAEFIFKADAVTSDNSIMNGKAQSALNVKKHPEIIFSLSTVEKIVTNNNEFSGILTGLLTMAGKTKKIDIPFKGNITKGDQISVRGSKNLKMSDFGIDPPTAMLGALKTGDEVTIKYVFELKQNKGLAGSY